MKNLIRGVYRTLPLKQPVFEMMRKFTRPSERLYKHLHFSGKFSTRIDERHSFLMHHYGFELENSIFWAGLTGGWEKTSVSLWISLVQQSDVIFDIGANTGVYSLIAKSLNPSAKVYAFEPIKRVFQKLESNVVLNNFDITCFETAASNADGKATVYDTPTEHIYSVTVNKNLNSPDDEVIATEIETIRLDTFIDNHRLEKIDLMKIDVETHEPEVLEGFGQYLERYRPTLLIEILNDEVAERVERLLDGNEYLYFNIDETNDSIRRVSKMAKSDFYNYLVCNEQVAAGLAIL